MLLDVDIPYLGDLSKRAICKGDSGGPIMWQLPNTNKFTILGEHHLQTIKNKKGNMTRVFMETTLCPGSSYQIHIVTHFINWSNYFLDTHNNGLSMT